MGEMTIAKCILVFSAVMECRAVDLNSKSILLVRKIDSIAG